jgi:sterol desaturase/sphingolipid hydroxylase (fatty acid hydroxylase superfamily)
MEIPMPPLETYLRLNGETLLYVVFFGALVGFGLLETVAAMRASGAKRARRWPMNAALTVLNILLLGALPISALIISDTARDAGLGLLNHVDLAPAVEIGLAIAAFSLQSWAVHYAMHRIPWLWRIHRVHHTDTHMDISTTVRFHPVEFLIQLPVSAVVIFATGAAPTAVMLYELADAAINVFSHSNIRLPGMLDRVLSRMIVTPHLHRIHHSTWQPDTDSNFGATLPVWDMLFGTYRRKTLAALAEQPIGLDEMQDARAYSLWWALTLPLRNIKRPDADAQRHTPQG